MNDPNQLGKPNPFGQGNASSQPGSPGGSAQNRPPTDTIESALAAGLSNSPADTQETVPRIEGEQNVPEGTNQGIVFLEEREDFAAAAAKEGKEIGFDNATGGYRILQKNGRPAGLIPVSDQFLQNYKPQQDENSPIKFGTGQEIDEYAKRKGWKVFYDLAADKLRYVKASGKLVGLIPTTANDLPAPESPNSSKAEQSSNAVEDGSTLNRTAPSEVQPPSALAVQPPPPARTLAPMPALSGKQLGGIAKYDRGKKSKITPAMLKNKVLSVSRLLVKDEIVFKYDGMCYQAQSDADLQRLVVKICEAEVYENGYFDLVTGTVRFIRTEPTIQYTERIENHRVLTFQNGNLDIETGAFWPHSPGVFTTYALKCCYIPNPAETACPEFDRFLWGISGGDAQMVARLWEMLGYCLVPDIGGKTGFVLQGRKHSGKSLLCNFLEEEIFPDEVVSSLDVDQLSKEFAPSELEGKMLCVSGDMPDESLNNKVVSNIKKLLGNDLISAPKKYQDNRQFRFGGKFILVSNHQLRIKGEDDAFEDRLVAIPFPYSIPKERWDPQFAQRLLPEKDSIVSKAIGYYWALKARHYAFSGDYKLNSGTFLLKAPAHENIDMRPLVKNFLLTNFEPASQEEAVFMADAHAMFEQLCGHMPLNQFGGLFGSMAVKMLGAKKSKIRREKDGTPRSCLCGLRLKAQS